MSDKADKDKIVVKIIPEGTSGLPPKKDRGPSTDARSDSEMKGFGDGTRWVRPSNYAKGGGVTRFKDDHCGHADMKRGGPVKGKC